MPAIVVNSLALTEEQKTNIAMDITRSFSENTGVPMDRIYVFFAGRELEDASMGGKLFSTHPPQNIHGKFNEGKK